MRALGVFLGVILSSGLLSGTACADEGPGGVAPLGAVPPGHEQWVGAADCRLVDVRDLRPAAKTELERLLEQSGYQRAPTGRARPSMRRDLQVLVENQGHFPEGYRPKGSRPAADEAQPAPGGLPVAPGAAGWLAEREAAVAAARVGRRLLQAFGRREIRRQPQAPPSRR